MFPISLTTKQDVVVILVPWEMWPGCVPQTLYLRKFIQLLFSCKMTNRCELPVFWMLCSKLL